MTTIDPDLYYVPARTGRSHHLDKGSKFIAVAEFAQKIADADELLKQEIRRYHDASHHCFAWLIDGSEKSSDAGEPPGTAGRPMLEAIHGSGVEQVVVVATRYFGGTKLGTGGLVRAYGDAARTAIADAGRKACYRTRTVSVSFDHNDTSPVHHAASRYGARQVGAAYGDRVAVQFELRASRIEDFCAAITEATHGRAKTSVASL